MQVLLLSICQLHLLVLSRAQNLDDVQAQLPWSPEPLRYSVAVDSSVTKSTLTLYPEDSLVGVDVRDTLISRLEDPARGGSKWTIVEIYDYECPHCWYAVPIYTHVAEAYRSISTLTFTSLNCHLHYNLPACYMLEEIAGIKDFPSFIACPPGNQVDVDSELSSLPERALNLLRRFPAGDPSRDALMKLARCRHKFVESAAKGNVVEDPFLSAREMARWVGTVTGFKAPMPEELEKGADFKDPIIRVNALAPPGRPGWLRDEEVGRPGVSRFVPAERWYDALVGFVVLLYQGYRPQKHQATLEVTRYLSKAFPVKGKQLAALASRMQNTDSAAMLDDVQDIIQAWSIEVGLGDPARDGDEKEDERLRSLTCSMGGSSSTCTMWDLLHVTLTAVAVRGHSGRSLLGDGSILSSGDGGKVLALQDPKAGIHDAQAFVRLMIENFLNCRGCQKRFLFDFDNCLYRRCEVTDWRSLPLWLWRVHNAISLHVASARHATVDRRWPMYEDCPSCWKRDLVMGTSSGRLLQSYKSHAQRAQSESSWSSQELDQPFHLKNVFWHLVRTYIGIQKIVFSLDEFHGQEKNEIRAVLLKEGVKLPGDSNSGSDHQHISHSGREHRGMPLTQPVVRPGLSMPGMQTAVPLETVQTEGTASSQIFLGLLALSAGVASIICFFSQDTEDDVDTMELGDRGETRAPVFRDPGAMAVEQEEDDPELVRDGSRPTATTHEIAEAAE